MRLWGGGKSHQHDHNNMDDKAKLLALEQLRKLVEIEFSGGGSIKANQECEQPQAGGTRTEDDKEKAKPGDEWEQEGGAGVAESGQSGDNDTAKDLERPDDVMLRRFLRAYEYKPELACERVMKMLRWRRSKSYGLDIEVREMCGETAGIEAQVKTGKCCILKGRDLLGRPVIIVRVKRHDPSKQSPDEVTRFAVYMLLSAEAMLTLPPQMDEEHQQFCIIFDLQGAQLANIDYNACKRIIYMLTYFFPERMGVCLLLGAPLFFTAVWHIIKPWLNAATQAKVKFARLNQLGEFIGTDSLPTWLGGKDDNPYFIE